MTRNIYSDGNFRHFDVPSAFEALRWRVLCAPLCTPSQNFVFFGHLPFHYNSSLITYHKHLILSKLYNKKPIQGSGAQKVKRLALRITKPLLYH
jgi:hypothetical protein